MIRIIRSFAGLALLSALSMSGNAAVAQTAPSLPRGFHASIYASGFPNPTAIAVGPDGRLYVAQSNGAILAVGRSGTTTIATGFGTPLGLAWINHILYVSWTGSVSTLTPSKGYRSFTSRVIISGLPTGRHQNDEMAFRNGWMYLGVGSTCDVCVESDARSATIMRFHYDGSHGQVYARGLRNPYGLAFRPATGQLYATVNAQDFVQAADALDRIVQGGNYGWPNCWTDLRGNLQGTNCRGVTRPVALFELHSSADGIAFYTGHTFPKRYQGDAFVAEWGALYGGVSTGHRVKDVHFAGKRVTVSDFATGLSNPLAVAVAPDSSLLVADYGTGIIWRIQANGH